MSHSDRIPSADIAFDRDVFLRSLLRELSGTLEPVVGTQAGPRIVPPDRRSAGDLERRRRKV